MPVPRYGEKHDERSFLTPRHHIESAYGDDPSDVPDAVVLTYQPAFFERVLDSRAVEEVRLEASDFDVYELTETDGTVGVAGGFGIGAPVTAAVVEQLRALGSSAFCILGGAGTLQPDVTPAHALLAATAIRDDGTSAHYLPDARTVSADDALIQRLEAHCRDRPVRTGTTWTTDAIYRETEPEVEEYESAGVLTVEMEAAALFAVAEYRGVDAAAVFAPFDALTADEWEDPGDDPTGRLMDLLPPIVDGLAAHVAE